VAGTTHALLPLWVPEGSSPGGGAARLRAAGEGPLWFAVFLRGEDAWRSVLQSGTCLPPHHFRGGVQAFIGIRTLSLWREYISREMYGGAYFLYYGGAWCLSICVCIYCLLEFVYIYIYIIKIQFEFSVVQRSPQFEFSVLPRSRLSHPEPKSEMRLYIVYWNETIFDETIVFRQFGTRERETFITELGEGRKR